MEIERTQSVPVGASKATRLAVFWKIFTMSDGLMDGIFWAEAKGAVRPPLLVLYIYCCWMDGMGWKPARPGLLELGGHCLT